MLSSPSEHDPKTVAAAWAERAIRRFCGLFVLAVVILVSLEVVAYTGIIDALQPFSLEDVLTNVYFAIGFGIPPVLYLSSLPPWRELALTTLLGAVLGGALVLLMHLTTNQANVVQFITGMGLAYLITMGLNSWRSTGAKRVPALMFFLPATVALIATLEAGIFFKLISNVMPLTRDAAACAIDGAHGLQLSFILGRAFRDAPLLKWICFVIYVAPPPTLIYVYALEVRTSRPSPIDAVTVLLMSVLVGYSLYFAYPVAGPAAAFGGRYPDSPPVVDILPERLPVPYQKQSGEPAARNGMPSLHFASVLLAYWHARPFGLLARGVAAVFLGGTFLATLGLGEHFFVDLVVALPFSLLIQSGCTPGLQHLRRAKWLAFFTSLSLLALWYAILFFGVELLRSSVIFTWTLTLTTAAAVWALERNLYLAGRWESGSMVDAFDSGPLCEPPPK